MRRLDALKLLLIVLVLGNLGLGRASARPWTLDDLIAIPHVVDLAISADGQEAAYIVRISDQSNNRTEFELHLVSLSNRSNRISLRGPWMEKLKIRPCGKSWTLLADLGNGVQLYEVDRYRTRALVTNSKTVLVGSADGAEFGLTMVQPLHFGIAYYDWSPDGKRLLYSELIVQETPARLVDAEQVMRATSFQRRGPNIRVRFFLKEIGGRTNEMFEADASDTAARHLGAMPIWHSDSLDYSRQENGGDSPDVKRFRWHFSGNFPTALDGTSSLAASDIIGPNGGQVRVERSYRGWRIVERSAKSKTVDYGELNASLSDWRSPGAWLSKDNGYAIVSAKLREDGRYILLRLDRKGGSRRIEVAESLTHCSFTPDVKIGVCIREGLVRAPEMVKLTSEGARVENIVAISPRHTEITPLPVERQSTRNAFGYSARNYVMYPRNYSQGQRYPAVVVTHGSDADQRFAVPDFQWLYPIQILAERGYVVILANDPDPSQDPLLEKAFANLNNCGGQLGPSELRRLIWFNTLENMRSLVQSLDKQGVVDPTRVGIAGYSYGSQMVNVAVTQSHLFKAASSGDGNYLEPTLYRTVRCSYDAIYGGGPADAAAQTQYAAFAPSYRASFARTPVLQQLAEPRPGSIDFYQALRKAGVPAQLTLYPGESLASDETHFFHIPANQKAAMMENLAWFDFWLKGAVSSTESEDGQLARWMAMKMPDGERGLIAQ